MDSLWTHELHEEAVARYQFIVVTPIGLPRVNVTDMKVIWALYPDFIFNTKYRIAGKKEDILKLMENVGYAEEDLDTVLEEIKNDSITSENFESVPEEAEYSPYDVEIAYYNQWKDEYLESQKGAKGLTLSELMKTINPHMSLVEEKKVVPRIPTGSGRGASGLGMGKQAKSEPRETTPSPKGKVGRKSTTLQDKIDKLAEDKLINVTKITATGTGTSAVIKRQKTSLFVSPNLPLTSSSLEGILLALDMLGGEDEYPEDYQAALDFKWKDGSKTASPKTTSTTSTTSTKAQSKTIVPEAVLPSKKINLLPPPSTTGRKPSLVSGLVVPENSEI